MITNQTLTLEQTDRMLSPLICSAPPPHLSSSLASHPLQCPPPPHPQLPDPLRRPPPRGTAGAGAGGGRILLRARAELTNRSAAGGRSSQLPPRRGGGSPTRRATPRSFPHTGRRRSSERRLCMACSSWGLKMTEGCGEHGWSCAIGIL